MSTTIEWTHIPGYAGDTWNPLAGCSRKSEGCRHCYAELMASRIANSALAKLRKKAGARPEGDGTTVLDAARAVLTPTEVAYLEAVRWEHGGTNGPRYFTDKALPLWSRKLIPLPHTLQKPLRTKRPTAYFVNSMSDLFHEDVPFSYIDQVMAVGCLCPQHLLIILTKRPEVMAAYWSTPGRRELIEAAILQVMDANGLPIMVVPWVSERMDAIPNVWLGTSVEDQKAVDARIPHLLKCPAAVRFLSCEPLLGPVDLTSVDSVPYGGPEGHRIDCIRKGYWSEKWGFVNHSDLHDTFGPLHWVITGGESGPKARPMHPDWARSLRDQCAAAGVPFFFKQWGAWLGTRQDGDPEHVPHHLNCTDEPIRVGKHASGKLLDGRTHLEWPKVITEPIPA